MQKLVVKKVNVQDGTYILSGDPKPYTNEEIWINGCHQIAYPYQHGQRVEFFRGTRVIRGTIVCHREDMVMESHGFNTLDKGYDCIAIQCDPDHSSMSPGPSLVGMDPWREYVTQRLTVPRNSKPPSLL